MRRIKISLKKFFYLTIIGALLIIFILNFIDLETWKTKAVQLPIVLQHQQQLAADASNNIRYLKDYAAAGATAAAGIAADNNNNNNNKERKSANNNQSRKSNFAEQTTIDYDALQREHAKLLQQYQQQQQQQQQQLLQEQNQQQSNELDDDTVQSTTAKPWYFKNGISQTAVELLKHNANEYRKKNRHYSAKLLPHQEPNSDRIVNQLMFVPPDYAKIQESGKLKTILLYNGLGPWNVKSGREVFLRSKCPVDTCEITANRDNANTADMILYKDHYIPTGIRNPKNIKQIKMFYQLECPYHTQNVKVPDAINWTATYRRDSDIVAPYEKWEYYDPNVRQQEQEHNYALNKTRKVAWFVSNCGARNGRLQYAHELQKYIEVDIYGACGNYKCSRTTADKCFDLLDRDYKFYLAFENSNCKDYITEKFFVNALNRNVLPIVLGARPEDYQVSSPHRSYIHVDEFSSPKELAEYLYILDKDDALYNSYFRWKGTGEFINTYFFCRVCSTLHDEESLRQPRWYEDINEWWRGAGVCTNGSWRNFKARKDVITDD